MWISHVHFTNNFAWWLIELLLVFALDAQTFLYLCIQIKSFDKLKKNQWENGSSEDWQT